MAHTVLLSGLNCGFCASMAAMSRFLMSADEYGVVAGSVKFALPFQARILGHA